MKKNLFVILMSVVLLAGMGSCNSKGGNNAGDNQQDSLAADSVLASFNYTPTEPVEGKKKAVVELGASGFNLFIIEMDKDKNWKALTKEFGSSLISENMTDAETIKSKLQDYIKSIVDSGVPSKDIHFVVSSGAKKETALIDKIIGALKQIGYFVNEVTPEQEATYAFNSALAKGFEDKAFVVDLGSGNTKISYLSDGQIKTEETYGAKYFQKGVNDQTAYDDVKAKISNIPNSNRGTLFLIGGVPFKMAKAQKKGGERFTVLSTKLSDYDKLAEEEGDKMKAGLNIYQSIIETTGVKQVVFDWDANFTIGFLLNLKY